MAGGNVLHTGLEIEEEIGRKLRKKCYKKQVVAILLQLCYTPNCLITSILGAKKVNLFHCNTIFIRRATKIIYFYKNLPKKVKQCYKSDFQVVKRYKSVTIF